MADQKKEFKADEALVGITRIKNPDGNARFLDPLSLLNASNVSSFGREEAESGFSSARGQDQALGPFSGVINYTTFRADLNLGEKTALKTRITGFGGNLKTENPVSPLSNPPNDSKSKDNINYVTNYIGGGRVETELATQIPLSDKFELKPFVYADNGGYGYFRKNEILEESTNNSIITDPILLRGQHTIGLMAGTRLQFGNPEFDKKNASVTVFGGGKGTIDIHNLLEQPSTFKMEGIAGGQTEAKFRLLEAKDYRLDMPMSASVVGVMSEKNDPLKVAETQVGLNFQKGNTSVFTNIGERMVFTDLKKDFTQTPYLETGVRAKIGRLADLQAGCNIMPTIVGSQLKCDMSIKGIF